MTYETPTTITIVCRHDLATSEGLVGAAIELTENYVEGMKTLLAKWVNDGHGSVQDYAEATGRSYSQMRKYAAELRKEKVIAPSPKAPKQVRQKQEVLAVFANEQIESAEVIDVSPEVKFVTTESFFSLPPTVTPIQDKIAAKVADPRNPGPMIDEVKRLHIAADAFFDRIGEFDEKGAAEIWNELRALADKIADRL